MILSLPDLFFMSCSGLTRASKNTRHGLTICTQEATRFDKDSRRSRRALKGVPLSSWLQLALYVFLKTSESESYSKKQGENFLIVQQKYVSIYFTR